MYMKVTLIAALTADGYIAKNASHLSTQWTSREDTRFFRTTAKSVGHMIVGSRTYKTFSDRKMTGRKIYVYTSKGEISNPKGNDVEIVTQKPAQLVAELEKRGVSEVLLCGGTSVYTQFLEDGVVDTLLLTYEPRLFGEGVRLFNKEIDVSLYLRMVHNLSDQTKVFEYEVKK